MKAELDATLLMGSITTGLEAFCLRTRRRTTGRTEIGRACWGLDRDGEELDRSGGPPLARSKQPSPEPSLPPQIYSFQHFIEDAGATGLR
jgi:hypothetical protein